VPNAQFRGDGVSASYSRVVPTTSPAGDEVQLVAGHVGATVEQLELRINARFGDRGLTRAALDLRRLVDEVETEAGQSHVRLRRTTLTARVISLTIIVATVDALAFSLKTAVVEGLENATDWVPLIESVINDLVFMAKPCCSSGPSRNDGSAAPCWGCCTGSARSRTSSTCTSCRRIPSR